jgi:dTDP-4-amino-4,6-dideoxygalactose transaminase
MTRSSVAALLGGAVVAVVAAGDEVVATAGTWVASVAVSGFAERVRYTLG